jgi:hypothetical protein
LAWVAPKTAVDASTHVTAAVDIFRIRRIAPLSRGEIRTLRGVLLDRIGSSTHENTR